MFWGRWIRLSKELFVVVSGGFLGRVHGGAQIVPEKNRGSSPLSKDVFWCCLRMILLAEYLGVLLDQLQAPRPCSEASVQTLSHKAGFIVPIDGKD